MQAAVYSCRFGVYACGRPNGRMCSSLVPAHSHHSSLPRSGDHTGFAARRRLASRSSCARTCAVCEARPMSDASGSARAAAALFGADAATEVTDARAAVLAAAAAAAALATDARVSILVIAAGAQSRHLAAPADLFAVLALTALLLFSAPPPPPSVDVAVGSAPLLRLCASVRVRGGGTVAAIADVSASVSASVASSAAAAASYRVTASRRPARVRRGDVEHTMARRRALSVSLRLRNMSNDSPCGVCKRVRGCASGRFGAHSTLCVKSEHDNTAREATE